MPTKPLKTGKKLEYSRQENGDTTLTMCVFHVSHLIQNCKRCSTLEVVHAISSKNLSKTYAEDIKDIFNKEFKQRINKITSVAIFQRLSEFSALKDSFFKESFEGEESI